MKSVLRILCCIVVVFGATFINAFAQLTNLTITNTTPTGRFDACNISGYSITVQHDGALSTGTTVSGGTLVCNDPCGTTTIRVTINNIRWNQFPDDEWLHGIFLPANNGFVVNGISLPPGFITYNNGCTGTCPVGITAGPGFYYDATVANACCPAATTINGFPCDNFGSPTLACGQPFNMSFNITFCNSTLTTTTETFTIYGTSDGATGCWSAYNVGVHSLPFTLNISPCTVINTPVPTIGPIVRTCVGGIENFTTTLTGACGIPSNTTWWTDSVGGTQIGSGSPFVYDPPGNQCPGGKTIYMSCCSNGGVNCIKRVKVNIPGTCTPYVLTNVTKTNGFCSGVGSINSVSVAGGVPSFTYSLVPSGASNSTGVFSGLTGNAYTVTVTDGSGCTVSSAVPITTYVPAAMAAPVTTQISCNGLNNGQVIASMSAGTAPFTYSINPTASQSGATFSNLAVNNYTITGTDVNGCTSSTVVSITQPPVLVATMGTPTHVQCFGQSNGAATASVSGGTSPYTYSWSGGGSSTSITGKPAGTYTFTVTDARGCTSTTTVTITQPASALSVSVNAVTNVACIGNLTGSITTTVSGGTTPSYSFLWSNSAATQNLTGVGAGSYTLTVTDGKGCTASTSATITQPVTALSVSSTPTHVTCFGAANGSATATVANGTSPFSYSWAPSGTGSTATVNNLAPNTYTVTVTDNNGCTATNTVTITQPAAAVVASIGTPTHVTCFGLSNGAATASASGGNGGFTFSWNTTPVVNGANLTGRPAGTYIVTATDSKGCSATSSVTITHPALLVATMGTPTHVQCFGQSNGSVSVTASGGTPAYTYAWSGGGTTSSITGRPAGTYTVTVTDSRGCTATSTVTLTQPSAALSVAIGTPTHVTCFGLSDGSASATVSGGTPSYTYSWSGSGGTASSISNRPAGTYTLTVTDSKGCTATSSVTITQPASAVSATMGTPTHVTCFGFSNGSASVTAGGGTPPYTYSWSGGGTTNIISARPAGTYTVTVTDSKGCTSTSTVTITQPASAVVATMGTPTHVQCFGQSSGSVSVTASGGTPSYTYSWTGGAGTASSISGRPAGSYTVTVTDSKGCTATSSVTITQPATALVASILGTPTPVTCFGLSNGSVTANATGGTPTYTYSWSGGAGSNAVASSLAAGTYTVTVTDNKLCTATVSVTITQPSAPVVASIGTPTHVACFGQSTGAALATATGGNTGGYTYSWSTSPAVTTASLPNRPAGTYTVTVTDTKGCSSTSSVTITQPATAVTITNAVSTIPTCTPGNDATITLTASGGTPGYTYSKDNTTYQSSNVLTAFGVGTFTVYVKDANNCTASTVVTIVNAALPSLSLTPTHINCFNVPTGAITSAASGGTPAASGYVYTWSPSSVTGANPTGLAAGGYTLTITDANNCTSTSAVALTQPSALVASIGNVINVNCFGIPTGGATASASGGTPNYSYSWSGGAGSSATASSLAAGTYTVTVTDNKLCTATASVTITQPAAALVATAGTPTHVLCFNQSTGAASVAASGGTSPYTYLWTGGATTSSISNLAAGTYVVTVTDSKSCTAATSITITQPSTAVSITNAVATIPTCTPGNDATITLTSGGGTPGYTYSKDNINYVSTNVLTAYGVGTFTVFVKDANGCTASSIVTIQNASIPVITASISSHVSCFGGSNGSINTSVLGGTPPIVYAWTNTSQTTANVSNLPFGTYIVTVTDSKSCSGTSIVTITQPTQLIATIGTPTHILCYNGNNGSAAVSVTGGTPNYSYSWSNGAAVNSISSVVSGTYICNVSDANNCSTSTSVTITQPSQLNLTAGALTNVLCFGDNTGAGSVTASGGTPSYTYSWSPNISTTSSIANAAAGTYVATVTDINSCTSTVAVTITQPSTAITIVSATGTIPTCVPGNDAQISIVVTGGVPSYTYSKDNINYGSASTLLNFGVGTFTVYAKDAHGCTTSTTVVINNAAIPIATASVTNHVSCFGLSNGSANSSVTSGTAPYTYSWSNGAGANSTASNLAAGTYVLTITDSKYCTNTSVVTITQPSDLFIDMSIPIHVSCFGGNDGSVFASVSGGTIPYSYSWTPTVAGGNNPTTMSAGTYTLLVTDAQGCTTTQSLTITQPTLLSLATTSVVNVSCYLGNDASITVAATGGNLGYLYSWQPSGSGASINSLTAGTYICTVTDAKLCTSTIAVTITEPTQLSVTTSNTLPTCRPGNDAEIVVTPSGGTMPYQYSLNANTWQNSNTFTGLTSNTYTVYVRDAKLCTVSTLVVINNQVIPVLNVSSITDVTCFGQNNGAAAVTASNGTAPYNYSWSHDTLLNSSNANNLLANSYTVTVTDINGCTNTTVATITEPPILQITNTVVTNVLCNGFNTGSIDITVGGGTQNYSYAWSGSSSTTNIASNLLAGSYVVTVTDAQQCTVTSQITVTQPTPLQVTISSSTNVSCFAGNNGVATASASGGVAGYTYQWVGLGNNASQGTLTAGTYTVIATDANNCTSSTSVIITQPLAPLEFTAANSTVPTCVPGSDAIISTVATGGTITYTYSINTSGNQQSASSFTGLSAGVYTITVTDNKLCTATTVVTVNNPAQPTVSVSNINNVTCYQTATGSFTANGAGGISPYTYYTTPVSSVGPNFNNLLADTYTVFVTDASGCTNTTTVTITEPQLLVGVATVATNVSCNGLSDASAEVVASGGTTSYSYNWAPTGGTSATASNLAAGTYTVTTTDFNGCTTTAQVTITEPLPLVVTVDAIDHVNCFGGSDGLITVGVTGGTQSYILTNNGSPAGSIINNLTVGNYIIVAQDAQQCTASTVATITQPTLLTIVSTSATVPTCVPGNDAIATINANGGTLPYTYQLNNGTAQASNQFNALGAGVYTIGVIDAQGCSATSVINVVAPAQPNVVISSYSNISCFNTATGSASALASNGISPYSYLWSNGNTTANAQNLTVGTYTVTATDNSGCTATTSVTLTEPTQLNLAVTSITNVTIYGLSNGAATVVGSGATPTYTYSLTDSTGNTIINNNTSGSFNNLYSGTFTATVVDANGCTQTESFVIIQPDPLILTLSYTVDVKCKNDTTGYAVLHINGGTLPYTFSLLPVGSGQVSQVLDSVYVNSLSDGTYTISVQDIAGATTSQVFIIGEPDSLIINTFNTVPPICDPANSATISFTATGGILPYQYQITNGSSVTTQNTGNFVQLLAGTYTATVIDANGCAYTSVTTLFAPAIPVITVTGTTSEWCNPNANGSITVSATGGLPAYNFGLTVASTSSANTISNLVAGTYTVYVVDGNNCVNSVTAVVEHVPLLYIDSITTTPASCNPGNDASALANISGGTPAFTYNTNGITQTNSLFVGVGIGTYAMTVSDVYGCTSTATYSIINFPDPSIKVDTIKHVSCFGFADAYIKVSLATGATPASYVLLNNGATNTTGLFTGLPIGTYTIQLIDAKGCDTFGVYTITQPTPLQVASVSSTSVTCAGAEDGTISINGVGGTTPYLYTNLNTNTTNSLGFFGSLAGNTTYTLNITDAQACTITTTVFIAEPAPVVITIDSVHHVLCKDGNDGFIQASAVGGTNTYTFTINGGNANSSGSFSGLVAGTYTIVSTDANNCTISTTVTITEPPLLVITNVLITNVKCFGDNTGALTASATGGSGQHVFSINNGASNTAGSFTSLFAGTYTIVVTDNHACTASSVVTITEPPLLQYSLFVKNNITCFGDNNGTAAAVVVGGTPGYTSTLLPLNITSANAVYNNLGPGTYTITTTDINTCTVSTVFTIIEPLPLVIDSVSIKNVKCFGGSDGEIHVAAQGGITPYNFTLLPTFISDSFGNFTNITAGIFTVLLQDANGCDTTRQFVITQPPQIVITSLDTQNIACYGDSTGYIHISAIGGTGTLSYEIPYLSWTAPNGQFNSMPAGIYTVVITDALGCTKSTVVHLKQNPQIILDSVEYTEPSCYGLSDGSIYVKVTGGVGTLTLTLNGVTTTGVGQVNNVPAGFYDLKVVDQLGCSVDTTLELLQPDPLTVTDSLVGSNLCRYNKDVTGYMLVAGGTPEYTYYLKPTLVTNNTGVFIELGAGSYEVTVVDRFGCSTSDEFSIGFEGDTLSVSSTIKNVTCEGFGLDGAINLHISGGTLPYNIIWSTGLTGSFDTALINLRPGDYWVTVIDDNGCEGSDSMTLEYAPCCIVDLPNAFTPNSDQMNDIFRPISGAGYQILRFQVYNRWGTLIFGTTDNNSGWDGKYNGQDMDNDTYFVVFSYRCLFDNRIYTITQDLILMR